MQIPYIRIVAALLVPCLISEPALAQLTYAASPVPLVQAQRSFLFQDQAINARLAAARFLFGRFQSHQFAQTFKRLLGFDFQFPGLEPALVEGFLNRDFEREPSQPSLGRRWLNKFSIKTSDGDAAGQRVAKREIRQKAIETAIKRSEDLLIGHDVRLDAVLFDTSERLVALLTHLRISDSSLAVLLVTNKRGIGDDALRKLKPIWARAGVGTVETIWIREYANLQVNNVSDKMPSPLDSILNEQAFPSVAEVPQVSAPLREEIQPLSLPWFLPSNLLESLHVDHRLRKGGGSLFDALSLLSQVWSLCDQLRETPETASFAGSILLLFESMGILRKDLALEVNGRLIEPWNAEPITPDDAVRIVSVASAHLRDVVPEVPAGREIAPILVPKMNESDESATAPEPASLTMPKVQAAIEVAKPVVIPAAPVVAPLQEQTLPAERGPLEGLDIIHEAYFRRLVGDAVYANPFSTQERLAHELAGLLTEWPLGMRFDVLLQPRDPQTVVDDFLILCGFAKAVNDPLSPEIRKNIAGAKSPSELFQAAAGWLEWQLALIDRRSRTWQEQRLKEALQTANARVSDLPLMPRDGAKNKSAPRFERVIRELQRSFVIVADEEARAQIGEARTVESIQDIVQNLVRRRLAAVQAFLGITPVEKSKVIAPVEFSAPIGLPRAAAAPAHAAPEPLIAPTASKPNLLKPNISEENQKAQRIAGYHEEWKYLIFLAEKIDSLNRGEGILRKAEELYAKSKNLDPQFQTLYDKVRSLAEARMTAITEKLKPAPILSPRVSPNKKKEETVRKRGRKADHTQNKERVAPVPNPPVFSEIQVTPLPPSEPNFVQRLMHRVRSWLFPRTEGGSEFSMTTDRRFVDQVMGGLFLLDLLVVIGGYLHLRNEPSYWVLPVVIQPFFFFWILGTRYWLRSPLRLWLVAETKDGKTTYRTRDKKELTPSDVIDRYEHELRKAGREWTSRTAMPLMAVGFEERHHRDAETRMGVSRDPWEFPRKWAALWESHAWAWHHRELSASELKAQVLELLSDGFLPAPLPPMTAADLFRDRLDRLSSHSESLWQELFRLLSLTLEPLKGQPLTKEGVRAAFAKNQEHLFMVVRRLSGTERAKAMMENNRELYHSLQVLKESGGTLCLRLSQTLLSAVRTLGMDARMIEFEQGSLIFGFTHFFVALGEIAIDISAGQLLAEYSDKVAVAWVSEHKQALVWPAGMFLERMALSRRRREMQKAQFAGRYQGLQRHFENKAARANPAEFRQLELTAA